MRKKKLIVLFLTTFILSATVIFCNTEQVETKRTTLFPDRDIRSFRESFRSGHYIQQDSSPSKLIRKPDTFPYKDNQGPHAYPSTDFMRSCVYPPPYIFPPRDKEKPSAPRAIAVTFNMPVSDVDVAHIIGEYQSQSFIDLHPNWETFKKIGDKTYIIPVPENRSVESMVQVFEKNPYVEYATPHYSGEMLIWIAASNPKILDSIEGKRMNDFERETNVILSDDNTGQETIKKDNGILLYPETDKKKRKTQSSNIKIAIRNKAEIYAFRDSEGRFVITNYSRYKSNTNNK